MFLYSYRPSWAEPWSPVCHSLPPLGQGLPRWATILSPCLWPQRVTSAPSNQSRVLQPEPGAKCGSTRVVEVEFHFFFYCTFFYGDLKSLDLFWLSGGDVFWMWRLHGGNTASLQHTGCFCYVNWLFWNVLSLICRSVHPGYCLVNSYRRSIRKGGINKMNESCVGGLATREKAVFKSLVLISQYFCSY